MLIVSSRLVNAAHLLHENIHLNTYLLKNFFMKSQQIAISVQIESSKQALLSLQLFTFVCVVFNVMALKQLLINTRIQLAIFCKWRTS